MAFSYTYSKLTAFEKCALQHQQTSLLRRYQEDSSDALVYGAKVHAAIEKALLGTKALPRTMSYLQYWIDWAKRHPGAHHVEAKWALDRHYQPTEYFGHPWLRYKCDFAANHGPLGWLVDWKTGGRKEEPLQLWLGALVMFAMFPFLRRVESMFIWLKEDDGVVDPEECISRETVKREQAAEIWTGLLPRIEAYETAVATNVFRPSPGRHCKYCRVQSCEFFGKGV